ncbi:MAG: hypothetical protein HFH68_01460 [Lachnospiraceae bacterium]|nr:hypothetical protein [Lachnospiraceae bacterium]
MIERMPLMEKATNIQECLRVFGNGPLTSNDIDKFYYQFANLQRIDITRHLEYRLQTNTFSYGKYILAGHRGVGKSTELTRAKRNCCSYYSVVIDASDAFGSGSLNYTNLLVELVNKVGRSVIDAGIIEANDKAFDFLYNYWDTEIQIKSVVENVNSYEKKYSNEISAKGNITTKFGVLDKLKLLLSIGMKGNINSSSSYSEFGTVDEIINKTISKNDNIFLEALNMMLDRVQEKLNGKRLLIILENLDKTPYNKVAYEIYNTHATVIINMHAAIIGTFPVYALYSPEYSNIKDVYDDVFNLGVVQILGVNHDYLDDGIVSLKQLVYKRMEKFLIEENALEFAIKISGGLIRDLFSLLVGAATNAGISGKSQIGMADVEEWAYQMEDSYGKFLNSSEMLSRIKNIFEHPSAQFNDDLLRNLLRFDLVLEYRDGVYVVHPMVLDWANRRGFLNGSYH